MGVVHYPGQPLLLHPMERQYVPLLAPALHSVISAACSAMPLLTLALVAAFAATTDVHKLSTLIAANATYVSPSEGAFHWRTAAADAACW